MRATVVLAVGMVVSSLGCAPGTTSSSSSSGGTDFPTTPSAYLFQKLVPAQCAFDERCVADRGRGYSSQAACENSYVRLDALYAAFLGRSLSQWADLQFVLDVDQARHCVEDIAAASCDTPDLDDLPTCKAAVPPRQSLAQGATCTGGDAFGEAQPQCGVGLRCNDRTDVPACARCVQPGSDGASCTTSQDCEHYTCTNGRCAPETPPFRRSQACGTGGAGCLGYLDCAGPSTARTCQEPLAVGATCASPTPGTSAPGCYQDHYCDDVTGRCATPLADGASCTLGGAPCAGLCLKSAPGSNTGTCISASQAPVAGQPCANAGGNTMLCAHPNVPTYAQNGVDVWCTCGAAKAVGQPCLDNEECLTGMCTNDVCAEKLTIGTACDFDSQCQSDNCEQDMNFDSFCRAPPMCG